MIKTSTRTLQQRLGQYLHTLFLQMRISLISLVLFVTSVAQAFGQLTTADIVGTANISNTPNFYIGNGSSGASFGNPAFGSISQTDPNYAPREFQFALKAHF